MGETKTLKTPKTDPVVTLSPDEIRIVTAALDGVAALGGVTNPEQWSLLPESEILRLVGTADKWKERSMDELVGRLVFQQWITEITRRNGNVEMELELESKLYKTLGLLGRRLK